MVTKKLIAKKQEKIPHMVFVDGGNNPRQVHESLKEARQEAKRLAENHPNRLVRVLRLEEQYIGNVTPDAVPYVFPEREEDMPF